MRESGSRAPGLELDRPRAHELSEPIETMPSIRCPEARLGRWGKEVGAHAESLVRVRYTDDECVICKVRHVCDRSKPGRRDTTNWLVRRVQARIAQHGGPAIQCGPIGGSEGDERKACLHFRCEEGAHCIYCRCQRDTKSADPVAYKPDKPLQPGKLVSPVQSHIQHDSKVPKGRLRGQRNDGIPTVDGVQGRHQVRVAGDDKLGLFGVYFPGVGTEKGPHEIVQGPDVPEGCRKSGSVICVPEGRNA